MHTTHGRNRLEALLESEEERDFATMDSSTQGESKEEKVDTFLVIINSISIFIADAPCLGGRAEAASAEASAGLRTSGATACPGPPSGCVGGRGVLDGAVPEGR